MEKHSLFNSLSYRGWIQNHLKSLPKKGRGQLTRLAEHLRCNTTLISQIMSGSRDFSDEQAIETAQFFGLTGLEKEYFLLLVQLEKAGTTHLKDYLKQKLTDIKSQAQELKNRVITDRKLTEEERTTFYSNWIYSAIRLYCSLDQGKTLEEICDKFHLTRLRAQEALNFLVNTGLCEEKKGVYRMGTQSTFVEQSSPHYLKHLTNWRLKAVAAAEEGQATNFLITAPMSLSQKDFEYIRESLMQTVKEVVARVKDSKEETTACMNIDFFKF